MRYKKKKDSLHIHVAIAHVCVFCVRLLIFECQSECQFMCALEFTIDAHTRNTYV